MARKLVFSGEIGNDLVREVWKGGWSELILCSDGGCVYCMRAVCDYLLANEKKVVGVGQIMSSATAIIACGSPALCTPSCRFMIHKTTMGDASGGIVEMRNNAEELRVEAEWYFNLLEQRTKAPREKWLDLCSVETCFGATVALELGLVDGIL